MKSIEDTLNLISSIADSINGHDRLKLKAGSIKDDYDITELYELMTEDEKTKTAELAKLIHRDKKLVQLTSPKDIRIEEDKNLLISDETS